MTVPNVSEGRDLATLEAIGRAFAPARFLDLHTDPDHDRAVFTLAARQGEMAEALLSGARSAIARIDISAHTGIHPHVGALDVMPVVYLDEERRGAAVAETLTAAALIGEELGVPVFLYGELATRPGARGARVDPARRAAASWRAASRRASWCPITARRAPHPTRRRRAGRGAAAARGVQRGPRDGGPRGGEADRRRPPRVRWRPARRAGARPLPADRNRAQVSTNVHDHRAAPLREIVEYVRERAEVAEAELIGLAPRAAFDGLPGRGAAARLRSRAPSPGGGAARRPVTSPVHGADEAQAHTQAPRHARRDDRARRPHGPTSDARGRKADRAPAAHRAARHARPPGGARSTARRSPPPCSACSWCCCSTAASRRA